MILFSITQKTQDLFIFLVYLNIFVSCSSYNMQQRLHIVVYNFFIMASFTFVCICARMYRVRPFKMQSFLSSTCITHGQYKLTKFKYDSRQLLLFNIIDHQFLLEIFYLFILSICNEQLIYTFLSLIYVCNKVCTFFS